MTNSSNNTAQTLPISIEKEMKNSYLDYAMSVIVARALPDVRDGLKPVHRRIIYAMNESGCHSNRPYRKSARIVGDVMGKYHPHGDSAIYDALVRMAQDFSLRLPLVDGQGNFGSMDGDSPAAMRYTESRMEKVAHHLIEDIDKDTVDWKDNYDGSEKEPVVLPAKFPNMLVNGSGGIAVGMATNIPPHNLGEVIDACLATIEKPEISLEELLEIVPAPDFPTGGIILGRKGATDALMTGRGSVIMRAKTDIEEIKGGNREAIIVTEIPYQVNKAAMIEKIALLVKEGRLENISDLRDESDKSGVRVVIELKKGAQSAVVLNQLFKFTPLQTSFGVNSLALDKGKPKQMNLKNILDSFIEFRKEIVVRRINFLLRKARDRAHILIGLSLAVANIDEVVELIKASPDVATAKTRLMERFWHAENVSALIELVADFSNNIEGGKCQFTETQARAILDMRLAKLTGLEQEKINEELEALAVEIRDYLDILGSIERIKKIIKDELAEIKELFATPRRTQIELSEFEEDIENLIPKEEMVVTVTHSGYIKRVPLDTYRAQKRGGKGRAGMNVKDEDVSTNVFVTNTHTSLLFFSTFGKVYKLKTYKLPVGAPQAQGRAMVNLLPLSQGEKVNVVLPTPDTKEEMEEMSLMFTTKNGNIRRSDMKDFENIMSNGKIAIRLDDDDNLVDVAPCDESHDVLLASKDGKSIRFPVDKLRIIKSRTSNGVRGMNLGNKDEVISMTILDNVDQDFETREQYLKIPYKTRIKTLTKPEFVFSDTTLDMGTIRDWAEKEQFILTVTENGFGKRSSAYEYRTTNRGGKGILNIVTSKRNGSVVASFPVFDGDEIMLITNKGKIIRCPVDGVRITGRNTQGVKLFDVAKNEIVMSAAKIEVGDNNNEEN